MKHTAVLSGILLVLVLGLPVAVQGLITQETMAPPVIGGVTPDLTMVTMVSPPLPTPDIGWVSITSTPSAASVELDGRAIGITPVAGYELGAGTSHTVRISMEGYEPWSRSITVRAGEQAPVDATLKIIPVPTTEPTVIPTRQPIGGGKGWFQVSANVNGATVSFDGSSAGCTITAGSCTSEVAVTGTPFRTFTVQAPGYAVYTGQVTSWPLDGETVHLYATLNPVQTFGSIVVSSYPSGAVVYLDGREWHYTPATFTSVSAGAGHTVQVSMSGYQTYTTTVYVPAGTQVPVNANLVPAPQQTGSLSVTSTPNGADVYIDGRYWSSTPAVIPGLAPGSHTVRVHKAGYDEFITTVTVYAGQRTPVPVTFSPSPPDVGSIEVSSDPAGASLFLDGHYMGLTRSSETSDLTSVRPGLHTVQLTLDDYQTYTQTVQVTAGNVMSITARLTPVSPGPVKDTTGAIAVTSSPGGANVFLDNAFRGITPITLSDVPDGSHVVLVRIDGYVDQTRTVTVTGTSVTPVTVNLAEIVPTATKSPTGMIPVLLGIVVVGIFAALRRR